MTDPDVLHIARKWGLDPRLVQAVVTAEGGSHAIVTAVQCSFPNITTKADALDVLCRSCTHALCDFVRAQSGADFVDFWAHRWAPVGAENDPKNLNKFWGANVKRAWGI